MERWIQMHYQIKERELALNIARNRELFYWITNFYIVSLVGFISRYRKTKRLGVLTPLVPLSFITAYYADLAYGNKIHRIRAEADMIMKHEQDLLEWPNGLPTVSTIDQARVEVEMEKKMHPQNP
ncbi:plasminogen receptor (KT) isoform X2 [Hermetia illucens]|nr:plasminogen receptor (KT) isoform X2 [Hermetia illucens]XP_037926185.1 plasminogen receptor (KT) isoform X2 [Hermetia illucens]